MDNEKFTRKLRNVARSLRVAGGSLESQRVLVLLLEAVHRWSSVISDAQVTDSALVGTWTTTNISQRSFYYIHESVVLYFDPALYRSMRQEGYNFVPEFTRLPQNQVRKCRQIFYYFCNINSCDDLTAGSCDESCF